MKTLSYVSIDEVKRPFTQGKFISDLFLEMKRSLHIHAVCFCALWSHEGVVFLS
jgi:hypothetical protein